MNKIVFFGSGWYTIPVVKKLIPLGLDLVVTTEKNHDSLFLKFCSENNIQTLNATTAKELLAHEQQITSRSYAVLASFGAIIPKRIINGLKNGIINIHPSLLPKYKGPSPIQFTILHGETVTGVTIIKLDDQVDHGPVLAQKPYNLNGNETSEDLLSILFEIGGELVVKQIEKLKQGQKLVETPQDQNNESWSYKIKKDDGKIDINTENTKTVIDRKIRAFYPWPGAWLTTTLKGQTKNIKLLPEERIQVEGKTPMAYKDFVNGYGEEGRNLLIKLGLL